MAPKENILNKILNTRDARNARLDEELETLENSDPNDLVPETPEEETWKKRHSDLRSHTQKQINTLKTEIDALTRQLKDAAQKQIKFPKTDEEIEEWVEKYPDVYKVVKTIAMREVAEVRKEQEERNRQLEGRAYQIEFEKWSNKIVGKHPDFFDLRDDPKFVSWVESQPKYIRNAFGDEIPFEDLEDAAETIIMTINNYKAENKPAKKEKEIDPRAAARDVGVRGARPAPRERNDGNLIYESDISRMSAREYTDEVDAAVTKAMREGRFVYDLRDAAR